MINSDKFILLFESFKTSDFWQKAHDLVSKADMGMVYSEFDPNYPSPFPIRYGGEIIAGQGRNLQILANEIKNFLDIAKSTNADVRMSAKRSIYDNDEFFLNFACNKDLIKAYDISKFLKRIFTSDRLFNVTPEDLEVPIWHLPHEKLTGLQLIFEEAVNPRSQFWNVSLNEFSTFLGSYVGIPEPAFKKILRRIKRKAKKVLQQFSKNRQQMMTGRG